MPAWVAMDREKHFALTPFRGTSRIRLNAGRIDPHGNIARYSCAVPRARDARGWRRSGREEQTTGLYPPSSRRVVVDHVLAGASPALGI